MGRLVGWLIVLGLIAAGLLWPLLLSGTSPGPANDDPVVFADYHGDYTVADNGNLTATETIVGEFPSGRHGLFRYFDVANPNLPGLRHVPTVASVTVDGEDASYDMFWENGRRFWVVKIGDPDRELAPGRHTFVINYSLTDALDPGTAGADRAFASRTGDVGAPATSAFYWNVVAPAWNNWMRNATATIHLPGPVPGAQCSLGYGVGAPCRGLQISEDGRTVTVGATNLAPHTPLTVLAAVDAETPNRNLVPWSARWDPILGRSVPMLVFLLVATVVGAFAGWVTVRLTVENPPGFPLQYKPPTGLGPAQVELIRTEWVPPAALTATLFHLAEQGLVRLEQTNSGKKDTWRVVSTAGPERWRSVDPVAGAVAAALGLSKSGGKFSADGSAKSGEKLSKARAELDKAARDWGFNSGLLVRRRGEWLVRLSNAVSLIIAIMAATALFLPATVWMLPFAAYFVTSVRGWRPGVGSRRTEEGRRVWSEAEGFHRVLSTESSEARFEFAARKDLYAAYLPFAVAGGVAAAWAAKYAQEMGQAAANPAWLHGASDGSSSSFSATTFQNSFDSALSSSISAYSASQSSSSGGGSSGGGGGG
ncbi:hypothetical protein CQY22_007420, partial [Mycolicibacterium brumae]